MTDFAQQFGGGRALVTGGADGVGLTLAKAMTAAGLRVAIVDVRAEAAAAAAEAVGGGALAVCADVSDRASLMTAAEQVQAAWGGLEVLWANAGVGAGTVTGSSPAVVEWCFGVNVLGVVWTLQALLPLLRAGGEPRAVGITASSAALASPAGPSTLYAATKHATLAVAEAARAELAPEAIGVTLFCPGLMNTRIWDAARARPERFGGPRHANPAVSGYWDAAESPERSVDAALACMAAGGGWCAPARAPEWKARVLERQAAITSALA